MMKAKLSSLLAAVLELVATFNLKPASIGYLYQPKVPKSLK